MPRMLTCECTTRHMHHPKYEFRISFMSYVHVHNFGQNKCPTYMCITSGKTIAYGMLRHAKPEGYKQNKYSSKMLGTSLTLAIGSLVTGQRLPPVSKNACAASKRQNPPTRLPEESKKTASDGQCTRQSILTCLQ